MTNYYIRKKPQTNGLHAIHKEGCPFLQDDEIMFLGKYMSGQDALNVAKKYYGNSEECLFCCGHFLKPEIEGLKTITSIEKNFMPCIIYFINFRGSPADQNHLSVACHFIMPGCE